MLILWMLRSLGFMNSFDPLILPSYRHQRGSKISVLWKTQPLNHNLCHLSHSNYYSTWLQQLQKFSHNFAFLLQTSKVVQCCFLPIIRLPSATTSLRMNFDQLCFNISNQLHGLKTGQRVKSMDDGSHTWYLAEVLH